MSETNVHTPHAGVVSDNEEFVHATHAGNVLSELNRQRHSAPHLCDATIRSGHGAGETRGQGEGRGGVGRRGGEEGWGWDSRDGETRGRGGVGRRGGGGGVGWGGRERHTSWEVESGRW